jgi:hypothetical protein
MNFGEFVITITAKEPELPEFERVSVFVESASKEMLWEAMGRGSIHPFYLGLITQALHRRIIEARELEQARQRKLEEDARIEAIKPRGPRKGGR